MLSTELNLVQYLDSPEFYAPSRCPWYNISWF